MSGSKDHNINSHLHNYDQDTSSDTEDYPDPDDHRRRVFKSRSR